MLHKYEYIHFKRCRRHEKNRKTKVYECCNNRSGDQLGIVQWYGPWRQYCFMPSGPTVYNKGCLNNIADFLNKLMEEREERRG